MQITTAKLKKADGSFEYLGIGADANYIILENGENFEEAASEVNNNISNMDLTYQILDEELRTSTPIDVELNRSIAEFSSRDPQTNVIKTNKAKIKNEDGWSEDIPIGAAAVNIDLNNGNNAEDTFENLEVKLNKLNEKYDELKSLVSTVVEGDPVTVDSSGMDYMDTIIYGNSYQATSILPDEYQQVEYIESTGTQYIDTEVFLTNNSKIELVSKVNNVQRPSNPILGYRESPTSYNKFAIWINSSYLVAFNIGSQDTGFSFPNCFANIKNKLVMSKEGYYYNDLKIGEAVTTNQFKSNGTATVFVLKTPNDVIDNRNVDMNLYSLKIYEDNVLVRDYIPCYRKSDNEIGLYDLVNNVFYTNQGTGTFLKGNNVNIPNPDYPQDIEVIDGVNLFNKNNIRKGYLGDNGTFLTGKTNDRITDYILIKPNTNYYIYGFFSAYTRACIYDENKNFISEVANNISTSFRKFITPANSKYLLFSVADYNVKGEMKIQITEGTAPKPYLPYGYIGLEQSGKNLFPNTLVSNNNIPIIQTNCEVTIDNDNYIFNVTEVDPYLGEITDIGSKYEDKKGFLIDVKNNTNYIFSVSNSDFNKNYITEYDKDYNAIKRTEWLRGADKTITTTETTKYISIRIGISPSISEVGQSYFTKIQIEEGSTATSYEPYHSPKVYPINLNGNSIAKVGDVKDLLKIYRNGDVEIEKKNRKVILEKIGFLSSGTIMGVQAKYASYSLPDMKYGGRDYNFLSNKISPANETFGKYKGYTNQKVFIVMTTADDTLENFNANIAGSIIEYQLAEPKTIKLPSIEPIELWEGTNIFKLITNLDTTMQVDYYKNYEKYVINNIDF